MSTLLGLTMVLPVASLAAGADLDFFIYAVGEAVVAEDVLLASDVTFVSVVG
ncbi:hypothetical protein [Nocardioides sp.]|uniref:hypothetical protein n=1 Tax=Nocardioides sp. TaxID=35761 RepID=UPI0026280F3A|nr:hypothetical protein [Nocardioides sp.]